MKFFYNVILTLLFPVYGILSFFSPKVRTFAGHRREGKQSIKAFLSRYQDRRKIWLHASSAGELDQALAVFRYLKEKFPQLPVLITVFSESVKNPEKLPSEGKAYLPLDFPWQWRHLKPEFLAFITFTWDVFPNLISSLKQHRTKVFLCSAALDPDSVKLKWKQGFRFLYRDFDGIAAVDEENVSLFRHLYDGHLVAAGDTRYDTIFYKLENTKLQKEDEEKLNTGDEYIIFASTYKECEEELFPHIPKILEATKRKIWIFPHFVNERRIQEITTSLEKMNISYLLYSREDFQKLYSDSSVVVVDKLGLLAFAYRKSKICYVGGGFHHRIHNTGEPAACGSIPFTGPKIQASPIAMLLYKNRLLFRCRTGEEIIDGMIALYNDRETLEARSQEIRKLLEQQRGATGKFYMTFLKELLEN